MPAFNNSISLGQFNQIVTIAPFLKHCILTAAKHLDVWVNLTELLQLLRFQNIVDTFTPLKT